MEKIFKTWNNYISARNVLIEQQFIRTFNNPIEDFSEFLIAKIFNGKLAVNVNQMDYDVEVKDKYIQVKSIAKAPHNTNGYIITKRDKNNKSATHYAFVFFDNYVPTIIYIVNIDYVKNFNKSQIKRKDLNLICHNTDPNIKEITVRYTE
jgi:hypothetical protein